MWTSHMVAASRGGIVFWLRSGPHAGEPHGGRWWVKKVSGTFFTVIVAEQRELSGGTVADLAIFAPLPPGCSRMLG